MKQALGSPLVAAILLMTATTCMQAQGGREVDNVLWPTAPPLPILLGINAGYARWESDASFGVTDRGLRCVSFERGAGGDFLVGARGFLYASSWFFFSPRLGIERRSTTHRSSLPPEPTRNARDEIVMLEEEGIADVSVQSVTLDALLGVDPLGIGVYLGAGISGGLVVDAGHDYSEEILAPSGITYGSSGSAQQTLLRDRSFEHQTTELAVRGVVGGLIRVGPIVLNPELFYSLPTTSILQTPDRLRQTGMGGSLGILYEVAR